MWPVVIICLPFLSGADTGVMLEGSVFDHKGRPIEGAVVDIATAAPRIGKGLFCPSCYPDCQKKTRTGADGKFAITGLNPALKFRVLIGSPDKRPVLTKLTDPLLAPLDVSLTDLPRDIPAERIVRGRVLDDQGNPVGGALVECGGAKTKDRRWWGANEVDPAISDSNGEFTLFLPEGYLGADVEVRADGFAGVARPLLEPQAKLHEINIPTGTRVTGQLVSAGKPLPDIRIAVVQANRSAGNFFVKAIAATSDAAGEFEFNNLPANEQYVIFTVVGDQPQTQVITTKRFTALDNHKSRDLGPLSMMPALHIRGRLRPPLGEKLPSDARLVIGRDPAWDLISVAIEEDGRFEVHGLPPESYTLTVPVADWTVDFTKVKYQMTDKQSFGLRVNSSFDDLEIVLTK
jgi:hypothetical protein